MAIQRKRNIFDPKSDEAFKLSRSKLDLFVKCPRCFYLDRRLGINQPSGPGFSLNIAVDELLKKEFDIHRAENTSHPLMKKYGIDAVPFPHERLDEWRENFKGLHAHHEKTNFILTGAIDDIWKMSNGELAIVDYKATSTREEISLEGEYKEGYKRQMEIYQWIARHNEHLKDYAISDIGYFVYCNGRKDNEAFDGRLEFDLEIIEHKGDDSWVEKTLIAARQCLEDNDIPEGNDKCQFCEYVEAVNQKLNK